MKISDEAYRLTDMVYQHVIDHRTEISADEILQRALDAARNRALEDVAKYVDVPFQISGSGNELAAAIRAMKVPS